MQFERYDGLDRLADGVPALQDGASQRLQRGFLGRAFAHGGEEARLRDPLGEQGDLLLAREVTEEGAL
ncbi:hypothetical protein [Streptomyces sp. NBC_01764]|uniref:hypothetical protein n=1 Tax=Streptomyces sp. NBC_01764 TaxID=2975935 RepID=UPI00338D3BBC